MNRVEPEALLDALDPDQREVALQVSGPLVVRAGAGTGKTRAITYRIAYGAAVGAVDPSTVLAVTFTAKAAAEMRSRLRALGAGSAQAMTFHAAALKQLGYFWPKVAGSYLPRLVPHKAGLVTAAAARTGLPTDKTMVRDLAAEIEWAKVSMTDPEGYADLARQRGREVPLDLEHEQFAKFYEAYEQTKEDRGAIDFEDVLLLMSGMLESEEWVQRQVRARYRSFVVDEYQDVSPAQQHLLDLWRGPRTDLCVVGDVAQTIYSFAGASAKYLEDFPKRMKGARVVELVRDYRSTPQIVAVANRVVALAHGFDGIGPARGIPGAVRLVAQPSSGPAVKFSSHATDEDEAHYVANRIKRLRAQGVSYQQMAVLYRTNAQSEAIEEALEEADVPFQVHGGARFFDREEVKRALLLLRQQARLKTLAARQSEDTRGRMPTSENAGALAGGQPQTESKAGASLKEEVEQVVATLGWSKTPPKTAGATRERWANLDALVSLASRHEHQTLDSFVEELQERAEAKASPEVEGVVLSTLHAAKGLEWEAVHLVGVSEGLIPISLAVTPADIEEERRLLYVGITRAKTHLEITYAQARSAGRSRKRRASRFLDGIWPEEVRPARRQKKVPAKNDTEQFLAEASEETVALFEELRVWRTETAKAKRVPPFIVFPDVTLRDVATAKPRTLRQLGTLRGVGPHKLELYGGPILRVVRDHVEP